MNRALSGLWYGPLCLATVLTHAQKGLLLRCRSGDGSVLAMVALGVCDGVRNRYSRPLAELEERCLRAGGARRLPAAEGAAP